MRPSKALAFEALLTLQYGLYLMGFAYICAYFEHTLFFWLGFLVIMFKTNMEDMEIVSRRRLSIVSQLVRTTFHFVLMASCKITLELMYHYNVLIYSYNRKEKDYDKIFDEDQDLAVNLIRLAHVFLLVGFMFTLVRFITNLYRLISKIIRAISLHMKDNL